MNYKDFSVFCVSQRWMCVACLMVVAQSLPTAQNYHQGREAVPVERATQVTELSAWVGRLTSLLQNLDI